MRGLLKKSLISVAACLGLLVSVSNVQGNADSVAVSPQASQLKMLDQRGVNADNGVLWSVSDSDTPTSSGNTYYVDSKNGNDSNSGLRPSQAWKSITQVNKGTYHSGDRILFAAGDEWQDQTLAPKGNGLIISSYGSGALPVLSGDGQVADVIQLKNQSNIKISNLNISNQVSGFTGEKGTGNQLKDLRGIHVTGQDAGTLSNYDFHNLYVHNVSGNIVWISGDPSRNGDGSIFAGGWDKSKDTGGIVFDIAKPESSNPTTFNDVTIKDNVINDNSYGGIIFKQWNGTDGTNENWASRDDAKASNNYQSMKWAPHTNITIQNNYLNQSDSAYACDAIYLTSVQHGNVQGNITKGAGTSGIEMYYADDITVEYNETLGSVPKAGGTDSNGIDPDKETSNILVQYNYVHDNGDGILLCGFIFGTSVVRYNVIANNGANKNDINIHGDSGTHYIYNNIFYASKNDSANMIGSTKGQEKGLDNKKEVHILSNNIFCNAGTGTMTIGDGVATTYDHNAYYGSNMKVPSEDKNAITKGPEFVGKLTDSSTYSDLGVLGLKDNSPLNQAGIKVAVNGVTVDPLAVDFFGNSVNQEQPTIGVKENTSSTTSSSSSSSTTPTTTSSSSSTANSSSSVNNSNSDVSSTNGSSASSNVPDTSNSNNANTKLVPSHAVKIGHYVYNVKSIYMYQNANFAKSNQIGRYPIKKRVNRTIFKVKGYAYSDSGKLRYQVKNTKGITGYITAKLSYVKPLYYSSVPSNKTLNVIGHKGINAYKDVRLSKKIKHYKAGALLKVKRIVKYHHSSRYQLVGGNYISANKKLISWK